MKHNYCVACGNTENLHQHHLVPRSVGGSDDESNLITLCNSCHGKIHGITKEWNLTKLTKEALWRKKAKGERTGSIPYGFNVADDGIKLIKNAHEQEAIDYCIEAKKDGYSLREIADLLIEQGFKNRVGNAFNAKTIKNILNINGINTARTVAEKRIAAVGMSMQTTLDNG